MARISLGLAFVLALSLLGILACSENAPAPTEPSAVAQETTPAPAKAAEPSPRYTYDGPGDRTNADIPTASRADAHNVTCAHA